MFVVVCVVVVCLCVVIELCLIGVVALWLFDVCLRYVVFV